MVVAMQTDSHGVRVLTIPIGQAHARFGRGRDRQGGRLGMWIEGLVSIGIVGTWRIPEDLRSTDADPGGEGGIRTPDTLASMPHFECGAFNHSATSPCRGR